MLLRNSMVMTLMLAFAINATALAADESPDPYAKETPAQRDARMKWWREARFGMFIHWGVYSVPAGTYKDKRIGGIGEWIMNDAQIPCAEYQAFAREFNPVKYDPDEWVRLAREAGMKYIVITAKHHDGFALFDTKASKWDVVDATPYGKDLLKPLAEACRKHDIKLGFYYSQAQDWNHAGGASFRPHWDKAQDGDMDAYIRDIAVPQVREILSNYGPIAVLWWDTPANMNRRRAEMLLPLLKLQPGIIHNNRLGGDYNGDTETPEQHIPATGYASGRDWETCMTMNDTWGFKSYDDHWKSTETIIRNLVDIASKGGNYLLNVGPTSEGLIPGPSVERLKAVGAWMKVNGQAIYGTTASPFRRLAWGRCTRQSAPEGTTLYLHVFDWPSDGKLVLPGLKNKVVSAALLAEPGTALKHASAESGVTLELPAKAPDPICSVVVCRIEGEPQVVVPPITAAQDGSVTLPAIEATIKGHTAQYESGDNHDNIGYWTNPDDTVEWTFRADKAGKYELLAEVAATGAARFDLIVSGQGMTASFVTLFPDTGDYGKYTTIKPGTVSLPSPGSYAVTVKPVKDGWQPVNLKWIKFAPAP